MESGRSVYLGAWSTVIRSRTGPFGRWLNCGSQAHEVPREAEKTSSLLAIWTAVTLEPPRHRQVTRNKNTDWIQLNECHCVLPSVTRGFSVITPAGRVFSKKTLVRPRAAFPTHKGNKSKLCKVSQHKTRCLGQDASAGRGTYCQSWWPWI